MQKNSVIGTRLLWLLNICLLSIVSVGYAIASDQDKADEIFALLDEGSIQSNQIYQEKIIQLQGLIPADDLARSFRLKRAQCWGFDVFEEGQIQAAIQFAEQQLAQPQLKHYPSARIDLTLCHAWFNGRLGNVELAMEGYDQGVKDAYRLENLRLIADGRSMRGAMHSFQGNFSLAIEDLITAQSLYENLDLPYWGQLNLGEIATSYRRFGDPRNAIRYYQKLEDFYRLEGEMDTAIGFSTSIAIAEEELEHYDLALQRFREAHAYWKSQAKQVLQATVAVNMAGTLLKLNRSDEAARYLDEAQAWIKPSDDAFYSFMNLFRAHTQLLNDETEQAHESIAEAKASFNRVKNLRGMAELSRLESRVFLAEENYQAAFGALEHYIGLHQELDAKMQSSRTTEMRTRFDSEQIEGENRRLIENQRLKERDLEMLKQNKRLQWAVILLGGIIMLIVSVFAYKQSQKSKLLSVLAMTDPLTDLPNRRHIYTQAEARVRESLQRATPLSVILFDADHFKKINDMHGHEVGDKTLISLATNSSQLMRKHDMVGRVGGEEFLVLLPDTDKTQALQIALRLVKSISTIEMSDIAEDFQITISAGVASLDIGSDDNLSKLLKRADSALYEAKQSGRNCAR